MKLSFIIQTLSNEGFFDIWFSLSLSGSFSIVLPDKQCRSIFDIAFIIDSSGSIGKMNWEKMKRFVKSMLSKLDISPSTTHVAAIAYSTYPVVEMRFWNSRSTDKSNDVIDAIPWQRGFTYTDKALQLAATDLFNIENGMRRDVNKVRHKGTPSSLK